jgi:hypothetical protein
MGNGIFVVIAEFIPEAFKIPAITSSVVFEISSATSPPRSNPPFIPSFGHPLRPPTLSTSPFHASGQL